MGSHARRCDHLRRRITNVPLAPRRAPPHNSFIIKEA
jgi:hypothetical protein